MNYFGNGGFVWLIAYVPYGPWVPDSWIDAHMDAFDWEGA